MTPTRSMKLFHADENINGLYDKHQGPAHGAFRGRLTNRNVKPMRRDSPAFIANGLTQTSLGDTKPAQAFPNQGQKELDSDATTSSHDLAANALEREPAVSETPTGSSLNHSNRLMVSRTRNRAVSAPPKMERIVEEEEEEEEEETSTAQTRNEQSEQQSGAFIAACTTNSVGHTATASGRGGISGFVPATFRSRSQTWTTSRARPSRLAASVTAAAAAPSQAKPVIPSSLANGTCIIPAVSITTD